MFNLKYLREWDNEGKLKILEVLKESNRGWGLKIDFSSSSITHRIVYSPNILSMKYIRRVGIN
jgi:hypothetical protein